MGVIVVASILVGIFVLFLFFQFPPKYANQGQVKAFNWMVLFVCAIFCLTWLLNVKTFLPGTEAEKYMKVAGVVGSVAIETVFLTLCWI
jgi:hypothetical protein